MWYNAYTKMLLQKQKLILFGLLLAFSLLSFAAPKVTFAKSSLVPCGGYQDEGVIEWSHAAGSGRVRGRCETFGCLVELP
jgi:hypothetical protein